MQRLTIPLHDFVAALRLAIFDKDNGYIGHLIHDFVFCDDFACAKLDRLLAPVETLTSPYRGASDGRLGFVLHTSPVTYVPRRSNAYGYEQGQVVWEK